MRLNCLIIDDEPVARKGLEEYVNEVDFLHLAGKCENAVKASALLHDGKIDLLLLDIHMPKLSGIEFLKTLKNPPWSSSLRLFRICPEGYSLDIIDYLKPFHSNGFLKLCRRHDFCPKTKLGYNRGSTGIFLSCDHKFEKVKFSDVLYIEAMQNYCIIHTAERKMITYITFSGLESQLPTDRFLKVHKSFIVALDKITAVDGNEIVIGNSWIPVSRNLKDDVMQKIMGNNLFKR